MQGKTVMYRVSSCFMFVGFQRFSSSYNKL